jgi:hypothetical protein
LAQIEGFVNKAVNGPLMSEAFAIRKDGKLRRSVHWKEERASSPLAGDLEWVENCTLHQTNAPDRRGNTAPSCAEKSEAVPGCQK